MHDAMFAEQEALTIPGLKAMARRLRLDGTAFDQCLDTDRYYETVSADVHAGTVAGIAGTPALFVDGLPVDGGAVPFEYLVALIEDELAVSLNKIPFDSKYRVLPELISRSRKVPESSGPPNRPLRHRISCFHRYSIRRDHHLALWRLFPAIFHILHPGYR